MISLDHKKVSSSMKLSSLAEIISKLIGPITISVLSRLLIPQDFAIIATIAMCTSFINIFTDSGFSKYIILFDSKEIEESEDDILNVSFWTNFFISIIIYIIICCFSKKISLYLFGFEKSLVVYVAFLNIIITSFSSVQNAILKKDLNFKTYFFIRIAYTLVPLLITVPLAFVYRNFWSMIIGGVINEIINAIILIKTSRWKPHFKYSIKVLKKIYIVCFWLLLEGLVFWLIVWVDTFIVKNTFSKYQLGLFKNSSNLIISIMSIIGVTVTTVVFTALAKLKNNTKEFKELHNLLQKIISYAVFPMATGIWIFKEEIVYIILGAKWKEAALIFGLIAIMYGLNIVFILFYAEVLKAKGLAQTSFICNIIQLSLIVLFSLYGAKYNFKVFLYFRTGAIIPQILIMLLFIKHKLYFKLADSLRNIFPALISTLFMLIVGSFLKKIIFVKGLYSLITMILTGFTYVVFIFIFYKKDFYLIKNFFIKRELK